MPVCDPKLFYQCVLVAQREYARDNEAEKCNCRRQCRELTYLPTVSQSQLSFSAAEYFQQKNFVNRTLDEIVNDYCLVEVGISIVLAVMSGN